MLTRSKLRPTPVVEYNYETHFSALAQLPSMKAVQNNLNYAVLKKLKASTLKQGPWRSGSFAISQKEYDFLSKSMGNKFTLRPDLLDEFEVEMTRSYNKNEKQAVQSDTFSARLSKHRPLKYFNQVMDLKVINSMNYEFKFKFKIKGIINYNNKK
jgi:hypothetical protein